MSESIDTKVLESDLDKFTETGRWKSLKSRFRREKKIVILVDGPNLLRKVGKRSVKIEDVDEIASKLGSTIERYIFLNDQASDKLIQAMVNSGYNPIVVRGDIYISMGMKTMEIAHRNNCDLFLYGSRDARLGPMLMKLREKNFETAIVGFDPGFSVLLQNQSDYVFQLN
ncbi:MAG: NYN domain-containing protein [Candidatus Heimdallarchaeota archaeon]|nr:NYN domain-containing protein [Candidatus Heimdallarchaeota archaeon]MDH5646444.1 NYN domain-containing protein [Candidatus Heimdallarchaeota archaeon]